jgi:hypothetical protein
LTKMSLPLHTFLRDTLDARINSDELSAVVLIVDNANGGRKSQDAARHLSWADEIRQESRRQPLSDYRLRQHSEKKESRWMCTISVTRNSDKDREQGKERPPRAPVRRGSTGFQEEGSHSGASQQLCQ